MTVGYGMALKMMVNVSVRDHARDVIIVTDPADLRRLAGSRLEPLSDQNPGPAGDSPRLPACQRFVTVRS